MRLNLQYVSVGREPQLEEHARCVRIPEMPQHDADA
jgi:hypothetical protein